MGSACGRPRVNEVALPIIPSTTGVGGVTAGGGGSTHSSTITFAPGGNGSALTSNSQHTSPRHRHSKSHGSPQLLQNGGTFIPGTPTSTIRKKGAPFPPVGAAGGAGTSPPSPKLDGARTPIRRDSGGQQQHRLTPGALDLSPPPLTQQRPSISINSAGGLLRRTQTGTPGPHQPHPPLSRQPSPRPDAAQAAQTHATHVVSPALTLAGTVLDDLRLSAFGSVLPLSILTDFARFFQVLHFAGGEIVFAPGEEADMLFLVRAGSVAIRAERTWAQTPKDGVVEKGTLQANSPTHQARHTRLASSTTFTSLAGEDTTSPRDAGQKSPSTVGGGEQGAGGGGAAPQTPSILQGQPAPQTPSMLPVGDGTGANHSGEKDRNAGGRSSSSPTPQFDRRSSGNKRRSLRMSGGSIGSLLGGIPGSPTQQPLMQHAMDTSDLNSTHGRTGSISGLSLRRKSLEGQQRDGGLLRSPVLGARGSLTRKISPGQQQQQQQSHATAAAGLLLNTANGTLLDGAGAKFMLPSAAVNTRGTTTPAGRGQTTDDEPIPQLHTTRSILSTTTLPLMVKFPRETLGQESLRSHQHLRVTYAVADEDKGAVLLGLKNKDFLAFLSGYPEVAPPPSETIDSSSPQQLTSSEIRQRVIACLGDTIDSVLSMHLDLSRAKLALLSSLFSFVQINEGEILMKEGSYGSCLDQLGGGGGGGDPNGSYGSWNSGGGNSFNFNSYHNSLGGGGAGGGNQPSKTQQLLHQQHSQQNQSNSLYFLMQGQLSCTVRGHEIGASTKVHKLFDSTAPVAGSTAATAMNSTMHAPKPSRMSSPMPVTPSQPTVPLTYPTSMPTSPMLPAINSNATAAAAVAGAGASPGGGGSDQKSPALTIPFLPSTPLHHSYVPHSSGGGGHSPSTTIAPSATYHRAASNPGWFGDLGLILDIPRTATLIATKDSVLLELKQDRFRNFLQLVPEMLTIFSKRLQNSYHVHLTHLLHHPMISRAFLDFCRKEHSSENYACWHECVMFRTNFHKHVLQPLRNKQSACDIIEKYIKQDSDTPVNLKGVTVSHILAKYNSTADFSPAPELFEDVEEETLALMNSDSFPRFKASEEFKRVLEVINKAHLDGLSSSSSATASLSAAQTDRAHQRSVTSLHGAGGGGGVGVHSVSNLFASAFATPPSPSVGPLSSHPIQSKRSISGHSPAMPGHRIGRSSGGLSLIGPPSSTVKTGGSPGSGGGVGSTTTASAGGGGGGSTNFLSSSPIAESPSPLSAGSSGSGVSPLTPQPPITPPTRSTRIVHRHTRSSVEGLAARLREVSHLLQVAESVEPTPNEAGVNAAAASASSILPDISERVNSLESVTGSHPTEATPAIVLPEATPAISSADAIVATASSSPSPDPLPPMPSLASSPIIALASVIASPATTVTTMMSTDTIASNSSLQSSPVTVLESSVVTAEISAPSLSLGRGLGQSQGISISIGGGSTSGPPANDHKPSLVVLPSLSSVGNNTGPASPAGISVHAFSSQSGSATSAPGAAGTTIHPQATPSSGPHDLFSASFDNTGGASSPSVFSSAEQSFAGGFDQHLNAFTHSHHPSGPVLLPPRSPATVPMMPGDSFLSVDVTGGPSGASASLLGPMMDLALPPGEPHLVSQVSAPPPLPVEVKVPVPISHSEETMHQTIAPSFLARSLSDPLA